VRPDSNSMGHDAVLLVGTAFGIGASYLYYGFLQEKLLTTSYIGSNGTSSRCTHVLFLVFAQCVASSVVAIGLQLLQRLSMGGRKPVLARTQSSCKPILQQVDRGKLTSIMCLAGPGAFCQITAMCLSNAALSHVSYPLQCLAKSCKCIPVMLVGSLCGNKRYSLAEMAAVLVMTAGIAHFSLLHVQNTSSAASAAGGEAARGGAHVGVLLLAGSLLMDGATGAVQDSAVSQLQPTSLELMTYQNLAGAAGLGVVLVATGEAAAAGMWIYHYGTATFDILLFSLASAVGQIFIFFCIRRFGALACAMITTTRKFLSVVLSALAFGHNLSAGQWMSVVLVFAGIALEMASQHAARRRRFRATDKTNSNCFESRREPFSSEAGISVPSTKQQ